MSGRNKEELNGVTLLGNQGTKYPMDYAPEMLETFVNKHQDTDYFVSLIALNLQVFAHLQDSQTLLQYILVMCQM